MAREQAPAFQFYPKEFLTDGHVAEMSLQERGAYITLLCICWHEGSLSADPNKLANIVGLPRNQFRRVWPSIAPCFRETDGRLTHPRLDKERDKQAAYRQRQAEKGGKGAAARWPKDSQSDGPAMTGAMSKPSPDDSSPISDLRSESTPPPKNGGGVAPTPLGALVPLHRQAQRDIGGTHLNHGRCFFGEGHCGVCLPASLYRRFKDTCGIVDPTQAAAFVDQWAETIDRAWAGTPIGDSDFKFWEWRWSERLGTTKKSASTQQMEVIAESSGGFLSRG